MNVVRKATNPRYGFEKISILLLCRNRRKEIIASFPRLAEYHMTLCMSCQALVTKSHITPSLPIREEEGESPPG